MVRQRMVLTPELGTCQ